MLQSSENIADLCKALAICQGQLKPAVKDSTNPHFKSKYADLASVWEACRAPLSDNGLAVIQFPAEFENNVMILITRLTHESGQWIEQRMTCPVSKPDPQGIGSCLSYMRRYSLSAVLGIYQDDDDANSASLAPRERPATLTTEEIAQITELAEKTDTDIKNIATHFGKPIIQDIERLHFNKIISSLNKKVKEE